jgi:hypothetical protein
MDNPELRKDFVFTSDQEENIIKHYVVSKNVSSFQSRAIVLYRIWLCKKIKSYVTLKDIDVQHEGTGCVDY